MVVRQNPRILPAAFLSVVAVSLSLLLTSTLLAPPAAVASFSLPPPTFVCVASRGRPPASSSSSSSSSLPSSPLEGPDGGGGGGGDGGGDDDDDEDLRIIDDHSYSNDAAAAAVGRGRGSRGVGRPTTMHRREALRRSSSAASSLVVVDVVVAAAAGLFLSSPLPRVSIANAGGDSKSRTAGYDIRRTESQWSELLSPSQYFVLRDGGTEAPYSSILEGEGRAGTYACAGCGTPLFDASQKFHSGTGWPSFARALAGGDGGDDDGGNVETEDVSRIQYQLAGAEVRCRACGGHLGDVFADGFLFPGTPAFASGRRYCIDGAALAFVPTTMAKKKGGSEEEGMIEIVMGDRPPVGGGGGGGIGPVFPG